MGERGVDLERLASLLHLLAPEILERPHVVQPVGELDQDDPQVVGHRDDHLAVVLGLGVLAALELDPGQLGDALDEIRDLLSELGPYLVCTHVGVFDYVVEERSGDRLVVEPQLGTDLRDAERVVDERLTGAALLPLVCSRREVEGSREQLVVDVRVVRRDLGEQLLEEVFVSFGGIDQGHSQIVDRAPSVAALPVSRGEDSPFRHRTHGGCAQTTSQAQTRRRGPRAGARSHRAEPPASTSATRISLGRAL